VRRRRAFEEERSHAGGVQLVNHGRQFGLSHAVDRKRVLFGLFERFGEPRPFVQLAGVSQQPAKEQEHTMAQGRSNDGSDVGFRPIGRWSSRIAKGSCDNRRRLLHQSPSLGTARAPDSFRSRSGDRGTPRKSDC
jgi:hypothetical protein